MIDLLLPIFQDIVVAEIQRSWGEGRRDVSLYDEEEAKIAALGVEGCWWRGPEGFGRDCGCPVAAVVRDL